ncbi:NblA/ycf18 family protein [Waterburya agarophytonicola K14]|uniref:NblA/ycf18 family protein n=1 Tax=Waterburya agarophytonicola KI4 TaxID=2874699 RepID=A0A964FHC1_9CYAN|nr:NblA/ycf18 family protein [Waterburya agarophytonicola]MCC0178932.1 NblA/ycf18 family protein [Waterburya agarophytonicola KI4]
MNGNTSGFQLNMDLTMEQKFKMRIFEESVRAMNPDEARDLLLQASKLLMLKDNIIKDLMKHEYI